MKDELIFLDEAIPISSPICDKCRNYRYGRKCTAYPERHSIPLEIWLGDHDHKTPYEGDHGIHFEEREI